MIDEGRHLERGTSLTGGVTAALEIPAPQREVCVPDQERGFASLCCCYSRIQQSNLCKSRSRRPGFTAAENICLVPHTVTAPIVRVVVGESAGAE